MARLSIVSVLLMFVVGCAHSGPAPSHEAVLEMRARALAELAVGQNLSPGDPVRFPAGNEFSCVIRPNSATFVSFRPEDGAADRKSISELLSKMVGEMKECPEDVSKLSKDFVIVSAVVDTVDGDAFIIFGVRSEWAASGVYQFRFVQRGDRFELQSISLRGIADHAVLEDVDR